VNTKRQGGHRGAFTALDAMAGALLAAIALLPLLRLGIDTGREAGFSEAYLLAHARAGAVLDAAESLGWRELSLRVSSQSFDIQQIAGAPPAAIATAGDHAERLTVEAPGDGLLLLRVELAWSAATDARALSPHRVTLLRMLARPDGSWTGRSPVTL
jgi:hypothetical protein